MYIVSGTGQVMSGFFGRPAHHDAGPVKFRACSVRDPLNSVLSARQDIHFACPLRHFIGRRKTVRSKFLDSLCDSRLKTNSHGILHHYMFAKGAFYVRCMYKTHIISPPISGISISGTGNSSALFWRRSCSKKGA